MVINKKFKEIFSVIAVILGLVLLQWRLWITNELSVTHDSIIWYGLFSYFADCLHNGFLPLWNPYMNCGEPFFLNISMLHLWDPSTLLLVLIGKFIKINFLTLYHYDLLLRYIIFICGSYIFFRRAVKYKISALIGFITISFSSLSASYLRQHGFILTFYLLPWILLFICNFLERRNPKFLLWIAFLFGITIPSQHSMFAISSLTILLLFLFLTKGLPRPRLKIFTKNYIMCFVALFIFILMISLLVAYFLYSRDVVPTVRIFEAPGAAHSFPADFSNLLTPYSFMLHFFNWYFMSESFLYIGLIPLLFVIIGLWFSRHKYKLAFILTAVTIVLLMLGDKYFVYPLFCKLFPFFSIIRNTHTFGTFLIFCLSFFTCLGADVIFDTAHTSKISFFHRKISMLVILVCILAILSNIYIRARLPFVISKYNIINGYPSLNTEESVASLFKLLDKSILNLLLFFTGSIIIFTCLKRKRTNLNIKYSVAILFILIDLFLFNHTFFKFVTMQRNNAVPAGFSKPVYNDFRIPFIKPEYPYYAFTPAMLKIFTAYSTKIPWITTHFYEMKYFYEFTNNSKIADDVKNVLMGISVPKLRFVGKCAILSPVQMVEKLEGMDINTAKKIVFIEEKLPPMYAYLEGYDDINYEESEWWRIEVISFNPNEIVANVYADRDGFLYYSDNFDKAWRVFIDGREGKIYKTNLSFKSVIVNKGNHIVRFIYDPKLYKITLFCYFAGILISLAMLICVLPMVYRVKVYNSPIN